MSLSVPLRELVSEPIEITGVPNQLRFLHGVSFDEKELAYVQLRLDVEQICLRQLSDFGCD